VLFNSSFIGCLAMPIAARSLNHRVPQIGDSLYRGAVYRSAVATSAYAARRGRRMTRKAVLRHADGTVADGRWE